MTGDLKARGLIRRDTGFLEAGISIDIDSNYPDGFPISTDIPELTVTAIPTATPSFGFSECAVKIGEEMCDNCTVCSNEREFTFDCSNIDLYKDNPDVFQYPAPKVDECVGFMLVKASF